MHQSEVLNELAREGDGADIWLMLNPYRKENESIVKWQCENGKCVIY